jgi:hypothetical protein
MYNDNQLDNTIAVFCTARIPCDVRPINDSPTKRAHLTSSQLLNEFFIEAFKAPELKAVECTHIGK